GRVKRRRGKLPHPCSLSPRLGRARFQQSPRSGLEAHRKLSAARGMLGAAASCGGGSILLLLSAETSTPRMLGERRTRQVSTHQIPHLSPELSIFTNAGVPYHVPPSLHRRNQLQFEGSSLLQAAKGSASANEFGFHFLETGDSLTRSCRQTILL